MTGSPDQDFIDTTGVDHTTGIHPAFGGTIAAIAQPLQLTGRVGVAVDGDGAARLHGQAQQPLRRIQTLGSRVHLDGLAVLGSDGEDLLGIERGSGRPLPTTLRPVQ